MALFFISNFRVSPVRCLSMIEIETRSHRQGIRVDCMGSPSVFLRLLRVFCYTNNIECVRHSGRTWCVALVLLERKTFYIGNEVVAILDALFDVDVLVYLGTYQDICRSSCR